MKCDNKFSLMQEQQFQKGLIHFLITALRNSNTRKSVFSSVWQSQFHHQIQQYQRCYIYFLCACVVIK